MSDYKPGTVATVSTHVRESARAVRRGGVWHFLDDEGYALDAYVSDVRPLVVLDLDKVYACDAERDPAAVVRYLRGTSSAVAFAIADQIEAQSRPPKPAEPTGLGAVVEDTEGVTYVRAREHAQHPWTEAVQYGKWREWSQIDAVKVVRP